MNFKRILSLLLVLCMIFSLTACGSKSAGGKKDAGTANGDNNTVSSGQSGAGDAAQTGNNTTGGSQGSSSGDKPTDSNSTSDDNPYKDLKEVDLPKDYPSDAFPIYQGGKVYSATQDERDNFNYFTVMAAFAADFDTLDKYYSGIIKDAEELKDQTASGFTVYTGKTKGYQFTLSLIKDATNEKYSQMTLELKEIPSAKKLLETLAEGELPEGYPADLFPIIEGSAISNASESENDGKVSFDLTLYIDKSFKDIVSFYEEKIGAIEGKNKSLTTDSFELNGTAHKYSFDIYGDRVTENNVELTRFYIRLQPVSE